MAGLQEKGRGAEAAFTLLRVLLPVLLALVVGGLILVALGKDPLAYYRFVVERGLLSPIGLQASITRMAPLLLIAAGLIVAFRAGLWNLGVDGQFLLAAVFVAALAPSLVAGGLPHILVILVCFAVAAAIGAAWSVIPAYLKAEHGINEIISTLMMSFLGVSLANVLIKLPFNDPSTTVPQTATLAVEDRLARLGGTTIHWGVLLGLAAVIGVHYLMSRTSLGLKLQIVGSNPRTAIHAGIDVRRLTFLAFAISAAFAGLGGAVDVMGVQGTIRADWNPAYGILVIPLIFLARFNGWAVIGFVFFFAVLMIGGESAARRMGVPTFYVLVQVALLLVFFAVVEMLDHARQKRRGA
ncbi:nucleoside ABC transporter membrane protein [Tistlia consotensis]|uniref:Nucleoside ABC transporter membrane protein n=1 Tax=Tistlia consotensis USBA 355 TaxID=560819 RepID=A0A1Y6CJD5_9PROT|nr:ABC transporter permease [Tistlia consotensis]SMF57173.1 nucleoside ABC transporter membrane protein [Tistlia consotensis USBA 355]SNR45496.1 nucleoside ABC transporter membrane protein [Tistlia consotensis]